MEVTIERTRPAYGRVTTHWEISTMNSEPAAFRFSVTSGILVFESGELSKTIMIEVLRDNQPKVNQEYTIRLLNLVTEGVRDTGAAVLSELKGEALLTIEGGNDPHGVFSFGQNSLRRIVDEADAVISLSVDRKFGAIGMNICLVCSSINKLALSKDA